MGSHAGSKPPPERTMRGGSSPGIAVFRQRPQAADWSKWRHIKKCELWEAVCLTLDIEPDKRICGIGWHSRDNLPEGFSDRMQIAIANTGPEEAIRPCVGAAFYAVDLHTTVMQADVSAFFARAGLSIPGEMSTSPPAHAAAAAGSATALPTVEVRPVTCSEMAAVADRPREITNKALCQKYLGRWPSVGDDLRRAGDNGLREAANAKRGWWREEAAIEWARARGKLIESPGLQNSVFTHRFKG